MIGTLFFDGACTPNPGTGGGGAVLVLDDQKAWEGSISLGPHQTSNTAEYGGLIFGLKKVEELSLPLTKLRVIGDSLLVIQQVQRVFQCQALNLQPLLAQALGISNKLSLSYPVEFAQCDRAFNTIADALSSKGAAGLDTSTTHPHLLDCTKRSTSPPVSPLRGGGGGGGLKSFRDLRVALEFSAEQPPPSAHGDEGSVKLGGVEEQKGVRTEQVQQEQPQQQVPQPQQQLVHQRHPQMALRVGQKSDYLKSLGIKLHKGRYPVKPQKQVRQQALMEGWDAAKLASEMATLSAICDGMGEERAKLDAFVASKADTLDTYNEWMRGYGLEPAGSVTKAKKALSTLFVCLYDLMEGNFRTFPTISSLRRYLKTHELYYPLKQAKGKAAAVFLKVVVM